jgi:hypothetical protein
MVFKSLLIVLVFPVLLEDSLSIKKRTKEEEAEDEKIAERVNATLAEEEEEKRREDEKKKKTEDDTKGKTGDKAEKKDVKGKVDQQESQNEAGPSLNCTCPVVRPCKPCQDCPDPVECGPCPGVRDCPPCRPCKSCEPCEECPPAKECDPCPLYNSTNIHQDCPSIPVCPGTEGMSVPVALAVGAIASLLATGVAAVIGLLLRYAPPIFSGLLFVAIVALTWYLSSHYPETARALGGRVVTTLREATIALGHRVMEAIRHHNDQVGFPLVFVCLISSLE